MRARTIALCAPLCLGLLVSACNQTPPPPPPKVKPAPAPTAAADTPSDQPKALSEEDQRLIALTPEQVKALAPEERKKRAYALRRKIMQNPDSPTAKSIQELADAARRGEIDFDKHQDKMPTFSAQTPEPDEGAPAGHESPATPPAAPQ